MTKEQYLQIKEEPEIPMDIWFEFYKEKGGILNTLEEFEHVFTTALFNNSIVSTSTGIKQISLKSALQSFYKYYDNKFGL